MLVHTYREYTMLVHTYREYTMLVAYVHPTGCIDGGAVGQLCQCPGQHGVPAIKLPSQRCLLYEACTLSTS